MQKFDFLIVGAGMFGATFAYLANQKGYKCLVIDKRNHIGGNCYSENYKGIEIHKYGAHIFHTDNEKVWKFINQFGSFNHYINQPIAVIGNTTYNLPFNMNTFSKIFNVVNPDDVLYIINKERSSYANLQPRNLEEQALKSVGKTIYELLVKNYTEKQWGRKCTELPAETIKRLPLRFTYDNNYFNDKYQGIPVNGYTSLFRNMLRGINIVLEVEEKEIRNSGIYEFDKVIFTGMIDEFFDYRFGELEYRSLKFLDVEKPVSNIQGNAVMNYPSKDVGYIRSIEHKHFNNTTELPYSVISYEFSVEYQKGMIPFYPVQTKRNQDIYKQYADLAKELPDVYFSGRLGSFKYFDMDDTIESAMTLADELL